MSEEASKRIWIIEHLLDHPGIRTEQHYKSDAEYILASEAALATAALRTEIDEYEPGPALQCQIDAVETLQADNARLREALNKYGRHKTDCMSWRVGITSPHPCSCGLAAALNPVVKKSETGD